MANNSDKARAADARAVEKLIAAGERWAAARERSAASAALNGLANAGMMRREQVAQDAYIAARDAIRARFVPSEGQ